MVKQIALPNNELERLRILRELDVLDEAADPVFDALVSAAAAACDCPIALISLLDEDRQWFMANHGFSSLRETPRAQSFCAHTITHDGLLEIPDAKTDPRFAHNPLVLGAPHIGFYAGLSIQLPGNVRVGSLCVIDHSPRHLTERQRTVLSGLAESVAAALIKKASVVPPLAKTMRAQQRLDWVHTSTPAMMHSVDTDGRLLQVSDSWLSFMGYQREEVIGHHTTDFLTPDSARYATDIALPAFFGIGRCDDIEYQMMRKDGSIVDVKLSARLQRDEQPDSFWSIAVIQDVTEQKRAEKRLIRSRDRMRNIIEGTKAGTWEWNVQTNACRFNERWAEIIGYTLAELSPLSIETWTAHCQPDDLKESMALIEQHLKGEIDHYDIEIRVRHRAGHWLWVQDRGQIAEWDDHGQPLWMMGTHIDITERKLAEDSLNVHRSSLERTGQIANVGGWSHTIGSDTVEFSDQAYRIHDLEPGAGMTVEQSRSYFLPEGREALAAAFKTGIVDGTPWDFEAPLMTANGRLVCVQIVGEAVREKGRTTQLVGAIQDITRRSEAERELARSRELLQVTLDSIADAVITTDLDGLVQWLNPVAERLTGWTNAQAKDQQLCDVFHVIHEDTRKTIDDPISRCLAEGKLTSLADNSVLVARDGNECGIKDSASPIRDRDGDALGVVLVFHDVSEQRRMSREMGYRATHDALTGLVNRSEFESRLEQILSQAEHSQRDNALMYIDLDQFKIINDSCGHAIGDKLLQQVSSMMNACVRGRDTLARLGGDEFGVILEHCSVEQAERVAQKICDDVNEFRLIHEGKPYRVGTSIGLVPLSDANATVATVLQAADSACYAAKEAGRNRVQVWREKDLAMRERQGEMQWASRIEQALDEDRFVLYGQRIVPLAGPHQGLHCEVLVRIMGDDGNLIAPGAFLPAAERYHLASRIDRWVVRNTFNWLDEATVAPESINTVSINLSGQSIGDQVFHRFLAEMIAGARFDVGKLCLEITETAAITHMGAARRFIGEMRELGMRIALDDFGAGASSFGYLKSLPVNYLKIDGQFVRGMTSDPLDLAAVRCFTDVARVVGIETVAEFVETEAELAKLAELGVDYGQGYLLHKPEPIGQLLSVPAVVKPGFKNKFKSHVA